MNTITLKLDEYIKFEIIVTPLLKGHEIGIKSGDKLYVWPDFSKPDELKLLEVPSIDEICNVDQQLKLDVAIYGNGFYFQNDDGSKTRVDPREVHLHDFIHEAGTINEIAFNNIIPRNRLPARVR